RMMGRGRADDTPETVARRIAKFHRETEDAIAYYQEKGQLVRIDGEQGIGLVTRDVLNAIEDYLGWF
nr:adenylate kinase [Calditrichia bacterium]